MTSTSFLEKNGSGSEPSMFVQRPSSGKCQDISHILTRIFRDEYAKDAIDQDTVRNLTTSKSKKSGYHSHYVEKLQKIQKQWEDRMEDAKLIEKHLKEAHSLARENEMMQETRAAEECSSYKDLGLPSVESHLNYHLNADLLRRFNLIVPQDFIREEKQIHYSADDNGTPQYARPTTSSMQRHRKTPIEDNYHFEANQDDFKYDKSRAEHEVNILKIEHYGRDKTSTKPASQKDPVNRRNDEKNIWRDLMKPSQRQIERSDLAKLQEKADFLKNPRFAPSKSTRKTGEKETSGRGARERCDPRCILEPMPYPVTFTDYQVGKIYEIVLTLKNITSSSRQLRVLPPTSPYFSIGHGKFPTSHGLVAPGMSCQYCITFSPDSLADYDDMLKVETQFSDPLFIPLQARRPPPQLTLSDTFNCGHCLVDGTKTVEFSCTNYGGEGRFCIVPKDQWPAANPQNLVGSRSEVEVGPFSIQPSMFQLKPNENVKIMVTFSPKAVKKCTENLVFVCDNCNTKEIKIEGFGETASVEFVSIEGGLSEYRLNESKDSCAGYLVRFDEQNPGTVQKKQLRIKNVTSVELEYDWIIDRPVHANDKAKIDCVRRLEKKEKASNFEIIPSHGKLTPLATTTFDVSFKPLELIEYHNVARLLLRNVPCSSANDVPELSDLVTIQIEIKGCTKPFDLKVDPEVLIIDGNIEINQPHELNFKIYNHSPSGCRINWKNIDDGDCSLQIEPNNIDIGAMEEVECYVRCVGKSAGFIRRTLIGETPFSSAPIYCHFESYFTGPVVRFIDGVLNFGLVRYMEKQSRLVELKNYSCVEANWKLHENLSNLLKVEPSSGKIDPYGTQVMLVQLQADMQCILNKMIEIQVEAGDSCYLETRAVIERPEVRFISSSLEVEDCFVNIPFVKKATLQNLTLFSVQYNWLKVIGKDLEVCSVEFRNKIGELKPREKQEIELIICANKETTINDLIAVCQVEGMLEPLLLSINAEVHGLKIAFSTPDVRGDQISTDVDQHLKLEFGYDVPMLSNPKAVLVLENKSAIPTTFSLSVEHFNAARVPTPPDKRKPGNKDGRHRGKALLTKTPFNADSIGTVSNKAFKDYCAAILSDGKGAAFLPMPSQGRLGPFEQIIIEITAFMDMWGEYNDFLSCKIEGLDTVKIPIHLECVGCPLNFQISKDPQPILRFGSHISGGETCNRSLRINNTSPYDIRLDWQSYISENNDTQLLDLLVMIGNPFPLRDECNREIESDKDITAPLIKVKLEPHQGIQSTVPFTMEPKQMIVPAKGHAQAAAKFIPMQSTRKTVHVQGYAYGYMSLAHKDKFDDEQKYLRCDGMDINPLPLSITGSIKPARLIVEPESENGFVFEAMASNLLDLTQDSEYTLRKENFTARRFVIMNNSGTVIRCSVNLRQPFLLLSLEDTELTTGSFIHELVIKQSSNVEVKVGLQLTHSLITALLENASKSDRDSFTEAENPLQDRIAKQEVTQSMELVFPNGTKQSYDLKGVIHLSALTLSSGTLNFGTCLIGQERELHISLRNLGKSACFWKAKIDEDYPETSRAVFNVFPLSGYLEGDTNHDSKNCQTIKVIFNARQNATYECQVTFADVLEKRPVTLKLTGKGSRDQLSEKIVNILT